MGMWLTKGELFTIGKSAKNQVMAMLLQQWVNQVFDDENTMQPMEASDRVSYKGCILLEEIAERVEINWQICGNLRPQFERFVVEHLLTDGWEREDKEDGKLPPRDVEAWQRLLMALADDSPVAYEAGLFLVRYPPNLTLPLVSERLLTAGAPGKSQVGKFAASPTTSLGECSSVPPTMAPLLSGYGRIGVAVPYPTPT